MSKKDEFKGYAQRFAKAGDLVRETITESTCPECGVKGMYTRQWRSDGRKQTLYRIEGSCPNGHKIERYGYGEAVA